MNKNRKETTIRFGPQDWSIKFQLFRIFQRKAIILFCATKLQDRPEKYLSCISYPWTALSDLLSFASSFILFSSETTDSIVPSVTSQWVWQPMMSFERGVHCSTPVSGFDQVSNRKQKNLKQCHIYVTNVPQEFRIQDSLLTVNRKNLSFRYIVVWQMSKIQTRW